MRLHRKETELEATIRVVAEHKERHEPLWYVLPLTEPTKCTRCLDTISEQEPIHTMSENGSVSIFCNQTCFLKYPHPTENR